MLSMPNMHGPRPALCVHLHPCLQREDPSVPLLSPASTSRPALASLRRRLCLEVLIKGNFFLFCPDCIFQGGSYFGPPPAGRQHTRAQSQLGSTLSAVDGVRGGWGGRAAASCPNSAKERRKHHSGPRSPLKCAHSHPSASGRSARSTSAPGARMPWACRPLADEETVGVLLPANSELNLRRWHWRHSAGAAQPSATHGPAPPAGSRRRTWLRCLEGGSSSWTVSSKRENMVK